MRDLLRPLGFDDAKVSVLSSTTDNNKSIRVEARVVDDSIGKVEKALASYAGLCRARTWTSHRTARVARS